jgi:hypothetical protein
LRLPKSACIAAIAAAALTVPVALAGTAQAAAPHDQFHVKKVLSDKYVGPLQFSVRSDGSVFVADSFTNTLTRIGSSTVIATGLKGGDLSGVAAVSRGRIAYTTSNADHTNTRFILLKHGKRVFSYNLARLEKNRNPDHSTVYGLAHPTACQRKALKAVGVPAHYHGAVDSHPYSVAWLGGHQWAVADAGGNDIVLINDRTGKAKVLAVLPRVPLHVTKSIQQSQGLPTCMRGVTYYTEGVPTDVEVGPHGALYVTSLPGGPEAPGLPPRGRVYKISQHGKVTKIGSHLSDATNLAVTPGGKVYVAELGAGRISTLSHGRPKPVFHMPGVVAVELSHGRLYASVAPAAMGGTGPGEVLRLARN